MHRIVGLDIAPHDVRLVALESGFRGFSVQEVARVQLPAEGTLGERLAQALPQLNGGKPLAGDSIAVSLPGAQVASFPMSLPFTDLRRIEQVLPAEVEGAIPFDLDEVVWDYSILSQTNGKSELLVAVVRKAALREQLDALQAAGLEPKMVTFAPLALAALGERKLLATSAAEPSEVTEPGYDPAAATEVVAHGAAAVAMGGGGEAAGPALQTAEAEAILDAGPERADFCVLREGVVELARSLASPPPPSWEAAAQDVGAMARLLGPLVRDLKLSLRARSGKSARAPVRLWLAGPLAQVQGAATHLSRELQMPVAKLALAVSTQLPAQAAEDPTPHALALGLALRAQQPRGKLNFRKGEFAFTKDLSQVRGVALRLAAMLGLLVLLAVGLGTARIVSLNKQAKAYDDALCTATQRILGKCHTDYREALAALRGTGSKAAGIPRVSATEIFSELVQAMPADALPLLEDVDVSTTRVQVRGTADGFGQVDSVTAALKKDKCFGEIKQPRVEKQANSQKVTFNIEFAYTCSGEAGGGA